MGFFSKKIWLSLTAVTAMFMAGINIGTQYAFNYGEAALHMMFGTSNVERVPGNGERIDYFKTDYVDGETYANGEILFEKDKDVIERVEAEGATLLWNKDEALPFKDSDKKVSLFSKSSVDMVESGSGSGWVNPSLSNPTDLKQALGEHDIEVNPTLWNFYTTGAGKSYTRVDPKSSCTEGQTWAVNEVPWNVYTDAVKSSFASYGDVAIVVLARTGGEYSDLHYSSTENKINGKNGNYLALTTQEKDLLQHVKDYKEQKTFKKVVLLLNTANPLQLDELYANYYDAIDACMWIGQVGTSGNLAVADLLVGEVTPSGHLPDTYAYDNESAPAAMNDGSYMYAGDCSGLNEQGNGIYRQRMYMVYQEGIYVGYKYYETRYEDYIMGRGNADNPVGAKMNDAEWNYNEEVAIPFGYGASYTTFEYSDYNVKKSGTNYEVSVTVKNVGDYDGKDAVQVYLQKPYTSYDEENGIEKASVELVGYAKTKTLKANGGEQRVTINVPEELFKTYDANNKETYIVEKGDYYLTVATDAHVAINNILDAKGYSPEDQVVMGEEMDADMGKEFVELIEIKKDDTLTYSKSSYTGVEITNQLDSGDINKYEGRGNNSVVYLSRSDWAETYPTAAASLTMTAELKANLAYDRDPQDEEGMEMPTYGADNGLNVFMFMNAPLNEYDENWNEDWEVLWNQLLDQMTWEEQALLCAQAYHNTQGAASIGLLPTKEENGPVGITQRTDREMFGLPDWAAANINEDRPKREDWVWVIYNCAPIVAATFNDELIEEMGQHKSEDMLYLGYQGIYGPGVNLHRSPFGGRNFEYPSEDAFLAGKIEAAECRGIESKGCMAYVKHYALNDMETNRRHVGIWSSEQASRELYLRAFEYTFTEGGASATMNSFTRVGARWCGASYAMMTTILRHEWGFTGIVISDWDSGGSMSKVDGVLAGTDSFDGNGTAKNFEKWKDSPKVAWALRESSKRMIYNIVRTNIMNGIAQDDMLINVTPWWKTAMINLSNGSIAVFGVCAAFFVLSLFIDRKPKKDKKKAKRK